VFLQSLETLTNKAIHDVSVRTILNHGYLSQPGALDSFEISLSLHAASPKIEALYEYYRDNKLADTPLVDGESADDCTGSWVEWYGRRVCNVDTLRRLIELSTSELQSETSAFVYVDGLTAALNVLIIATVHGIKRSISHSIIYTLRHQDCWIPLQGL
jgi:UDP-glucose:glycoprotein glucosyltransferase